jgi:hypothetical protein
MCGLAAADARSKTSLPPAPDGFFILCASFESVYGKTGQGGTGHRPRLAAGRT